MYNVEKKNINFVNLYKSKGYNHEIANIFKLIAKEDLPLGMKLAEKLYGEMLTAEIEKENGNEAK